MSNKIIVLMVILGLFVFGCLNFGGTTSTNTSTQGHNTTTNTTTNPSNTPPSPGTTPPSNTPPGNTAPPSGDNPPPSNTGAQTAEAFIAAGISFTCDISTQTSRGSVNGKAYYDMTNKFSRVELDAAGAGGTSCQTTVGILKLNERKMYTGCDQGGGNMMTYPLPGVAACQWIAINVPESQNITFTGSPSGNAQNRVQITNCVPWVPDPSKFAVGTVCSNNYPSYPGQGG
ncbi:hypothetical protein HZC07_03655 [Candidatus Micrarchaeota archaeon]|nr:hypothetical protein [Candidatus Micrarchaeota archaeon]